MTFKPLLSASATAAELLTLVFPLYWSPKLDGIRTIMHPEGAVSRKIIKLPNLKLRAFLESNNLDGFDGEMVYGPATAPTVFNHTQSCVMKIEGPCPTQADGRYLVFDDFSDLSLPFGMRFENVKARIARLPEAVQKIVQYVPHKIVENQDDLKNIESICVERGFEGVMLRDPEGRYKFGRSTFRDRILLKVKRFEDFDGEIVDVYEMMHNDNEATKDALGRTKRSSHQENMRPSGLLGGFWVTSPEFPGVKIKVGPGNADHPTRKRLWEERDTLTGKVIVAKHQPSGMKDAPRFATYKSFRKD